MDTFYGVNELSLEQKRALLEDAKALSYSVKTDILDCAVSWAREPIKMSWEDILNKLTDFAHFVVILRRSIFKNEKDYYEFGFSSFTTPDYFLWIHVDTIKAQRLLTKYNLTPF